MSKFLRFTALATLTAFLGLSALEASHAHDGLRADAHCSVCQIAQKTPSHFSTSAAAVLVWASAQAVLSPAALPHRLFLSVSHGLSPPLV